MCSALAYSLYSFISLRFVLAVTPFASAAEKYARTLRALRCRHESVNHHSVYR